MSEDTSDTNDEEGENAEDEVEDDDVIERLGREFRVVEVVDEDDYEVEPVA